jgi:hypothetical protein
MQNSFIIELCYEADSRAAHAHRVKITADDFQFAMRHKARMVGRVQELYRADKYIKEQRAVIERDTWAQGKVRKGLNKDGEPKKKKRKTKKKGEEDADEGEDVEAGEEIEGEEAEESQQLVTEEVVSEKSGKSGKSRKSVGSKRSATVAGMA